MSRESHAPSPPASPIAGHVFRFRRDPLQFLLDTAKQCGPVARLRLGPLVYHLVSDPILVNEVLQGRASNYVRDTRSSRSIRLVTGESLLSSSGDAWRRHRRLAQPVFHQRRLAALADVIAEACRETADRWEVAARDGAVLDLAGEMNALTFAVVGRCFFGSELGPRATDVQRSFPVLLQELFRRSRSLASLPMWLPTPAHLQFRHALATIDRIVADIITSRRRTAAAGSDLLGLLLQARDEDGSALSDLELRNHVITFLLAGHDTTASTLTWTLGLLDQNPDRRDEIERELDATLRGGAPTWDSLPCLRHTNAALHESIRLFPAIWIAERRVIADDTLGGFAIPGGSTVLVSAYVTQRLDRYWPEPDSFRPTRFDETREPVGIERGYFPFGAGPHQCIGQHFALLEARIVIAMLLSRFRIRLLDKIPAPLPGITLRPGAAIAIRVERR